MSEKRDWGLEITNLTQAVYQLILAALLSKLFSARVIGAIEILSGPGDERALMWTLLQVTLILGIPLILFELKKTGSLGRAFFEHFSNVLPICAALTFPISSGSLSFVYLGLGIYNLVQYFDGWRKLWRMIFKRSDRQHQRPSGQPPRTGEPAWGQGSSGQADTAGEIKLTIPVRDNERLKSILPQIKQSFRGLQLNFGETKDKQNIIISISGKDAQLAKKAIERLLKDRGNKDEK